MATTHDDYERMLNDSDPTPISLPLQFLKDITHDFSTVLGQGGFGVVYKGVLRNGKIIAVKKLSPLHVTEEAFRKEAIIIRRIRHQNILQFIGYCAESKWEAIDISGDGNLHFVDNVWNRFLCFEYASNQSLDKYITDASSGLEWNMRYDIVKGICKGLHYLHDVCRIIHLDLKPQNILMDSTMMPKIADFGMSRLFGEKQSRIFTKTISGTRGYMAPEYLDQGVLSKKSDIFSLGVIIIEIITGHMKYPLFHQDISHSPATSFEQFVDKVLGSWRKSFVREPMYKPMELYTQQVRQCITIALQCVDPSMEKRPTAKDIIQKVNAVDQVLQANSCLTQIMQKSQEQWLYAFDVSQTEPLILTSHRHGCIDIWNYARHEWVSSIQTGDCTLWSVQFIERKEWFVAGSKDGFICVYNYKTGGEAIKSFYASRPNYFPLTSLAVHPTKSYMLSACGVCIKLWDWDKNWECIQTYEEQVHHTFHLRFNRLDTDSFVGASNNNTVKIWSIDSTKPKYTLSGIWNKLCCLDFFTRDDRQYLITVSDHSAKIWDIQTEACIYTLEGFRSPVTSVVSHPSIPLIITGSGNGDIHFWSATNFRLKRIINTGVSNSACQVRLMGPRRAVIAQGRVLWTMEIHDEEEAEEVN